MAIACLESRCIDLDILGGIAVRKGWGPLMCSSPGNSAPQCHFHRDSDFDHQFPESAGRWQDRCCFWKVSSQRRPFPFPSLPAPVWQSVQLTALKTALWLYFRKGACCSQRLSLWSLLFKSSQGHEINLLLRWVFRKMVMGGGCKKEKKKKKNGHIVPGPWALGQQKNPDL